MNDRLDKTTRILCAVTWCAMIIIPLILFNLKTNQISEIDNTALIELDSLGTGDKSVTEDFETYVEQRIGLRNNMIDFYLYANDAIFGILTHPTYTYGRDGYVFFHMPAEHVNESYIKSFAGFVSHMQQSVTKQGIDFLYCINPDKTAVYENYLPAGANLSFPRQKLLIKYLDRYNVNYIDNTDILIKASDSMDVFDKKYDAGHWNDNGAYIGFSNILKTLSASHPEIPLNSAEDYTIQNIVHDKLPLSNLYINEPGVLYTRNNPEATDVTANDTDIMLDEQYRDYSHYTNPLHPELPKILVFRGSYFLGREKFMTESFSESIFVHSYYNIFNYQYYIDRFKPDIVLFESVEYATTNKYFPKEMLKNL